jgi:hypothetical protein
MRGFDRLLIALLLFLLLAMAATWFLARGRTRHGYGSLWFEPAAGDATVISRSGLHRWTG